MEKLIWTKPEMNEFAFAANEYVATSCGDGGTTYKFTCDAGQIDKHVGIGSLWNPTTCWCGEQHLRDYEDKHHYKVFRDNNGDFGEQVGFNYGPCGETHEATVGKNESFDDVFFAGWMDDKRTSLIEKIAVIIWRGTNGNDCHCTENLNISTWEIAKS